MAITNEDKIRLAQAKLALLEGRLPEDAYKEYCLLVYLGKMGMDCSEWWSWWSAEGRWDRRKEQPRSVMMMRNDTSKPFTLDNVHEGTGGRSYYIGKVVGPTGLEFESASSAAEAIGVKAATVRKWVRTGYRGWAAADAA